MILLFFEKGYFFKSIESSRMLLKKKQIKVVVKLIRNYTFRFAFFMDAYDGILFDCSLFKALENLAAKIVSYRLSKVMSHL